MDKKLKTLRGSLLNGLQQQIQLKPKESWRRGVHSTACKNRDPKYNVSKSFHKKPAFIKDIVKASQGRDVTISEAAMFPRAKDRRKKHFYKDRAKAINELHAAFSEHVNIATHQVEISLRNASDAAGLSTISEKEKAKAKEDPTYTPVVSISRASRGFADMVGMGWIRADAVWQVWDKESGCWIDKIFEVTPLFFQAAGITKERVEKQQNRHLGYVKSHSDKFGLTAEEAGRLSITQLKELRRQSYRKLAFERRAKERARKKTQRALWGKTRQEQRALAIKRVINSLGNDIHTITSPDEINGLVDREIATIRKFAKVDPPPH